MMGFQPQGLELLHEFATTCAHWLSWEIRGAFKARSDSGWSWPRAPGLLLSVNFQSKTQIPMATRGKGALLSLCTSHNL